MGPAKLRSSLLCNPRALELMWHSAKKNSLNNILPLIGRSAPTKGLVPKPSLSAPLPCDGFLVWARIFEKMPGRWSRWDSTTRSDYSSNPLDWCSWRYSLRTAGFCLLLLEIRLPVVFMTFICLLQIFKNIGSARFPAVDEVSECRITFCSTLSNCRLTAGII